MSIIHVKLRKKKNADKILKQILEKYENEIVGYDMEVCRAYPLSSPEVAIEMRSVSKRGGSLSITIPKLVADYLNLKQGDVILFTIRKKLGKVYLDKATQVYAESLRRER